MPWASITFWTYDTVSLIHEHVLLRFSYPRLVAGQVRGAKSIGLGDDGNEVDTRAQPLHHFDVEGLQGVAGRSDEVQASVHTHVDLVCATGLLLLQHVRLMLVVEELDDGLPGVTVVDVVSKTGGVNDGQTNCVVQPLLATSSRSRVHP